MASVVGNAFIFSSYTPFYGSGAVITPSVPRATGFQTGFLETSQGGSGWRGGQEKAGWGFGVSLPAFASPARWASLEEQAAPGGPPKMLHHGGAVTVTHVPPESLEVLGAGTDFGRVRRPEQQQLLRLLT